MSARHGSVARVAVTMKHRNGSKTPGRIACGHDESEADGFSTMWDLKELPPVDPTIVEERGLVHELHEWTLEKKIGKGEFATVYACRKKGQAETFACKMIHKDRVYATADRAKRLRSVRRIGTEIEAMKMLSHDSVCSLIETFHSKNTVFIGAWQPTRASRARSRRRASGFRRISPPAGLRSDGKGRHGSLRLPRQAAEARRAPDS